jgi:hypothetical protein
MENNSIVKLNHAGIELVILPHIGGRIAAASIYGNKSVIKSNPADWIGTNKPEINAHSGFYPFNGHIHWVGPQSAWWSRQELNAARKEEKAPWPPDPYLIYGAYTVEKITDRSIAMSGPESPVSGVSFYKEIAINDDGSIYHRTVITNTSSQPQHWDIWANTRMCGYSAAYVPVESKDCFRIEHVHNNQEEQMPSIAAGGFFSYLPIEPANGAASRSSKAFIYPSKPYMAAFTGDSMILFQFALHPKNKIHPEQALVEIYCHTETDKINALLEMEQHSPMYILQPGESAEDYQIWRLLPYSGGDSRLEHIDFITEAGEVFGL